MIELGVLHAGHSMIGYVVAFISGTTPFLLGLAIAVIIHIVTAIAAIIPTVNGGYPKKSAKRTTGIKTISIHNALRLLFLVRLRENHTPPRIIVRVI